MGDRKRRSLSVISGDLFSAERNEDRGRCQVSRNNFAGKSGPRPRNDEPRRCSRENKSEKGVGTARLFRPHDGKSRGEHQRKGGRNERADFQEGEKRKKKKERKVQEQPGRNSPG